MVHQKARSARQYARPGCCYELPIEINDDEQKATTRTRPKPISAHTASWLEAKARDRWQASTTATAESKFTNTATCVEENMGSRRWGTVNRPAIQAEPSQRCRKRVFADVGDDDEQTEGGSKRLRLPKMDIAGVEGRPNQNIPDRNMRQFHPNNRSHPTRQSSLNNHSRITNISLPATLDNENSASNLAELGAGMRTMQRNMDRERATIRDIQRAEEQARIHEEEENARKADVRERIYRSTVQSSLHEMWQDCDREREAAKERRNAREWEERAATKRKERQAEQEKLQELSSMEEKLKSMWEVHDLERGMPAKIRPGQLSEAGQRRVRERAEKLRYRKQ